MGKVSRYLLVVVVVGVGIVGFWVYQKYIKSSGAAQVSVVVERGDLEELIRVQGEVVPTAQYNLEFPSTGIVRSVYVKEGNSVAAGTALMKLDSSDLALEKERLDSLVAQRVADLAKLTAGATGADIAVYQARVTSAETALRAAEKSEELSLRAVFTAIDDAVRGTTDLFYSNAGSATPQLSFNTPDSQLKIVLEAERFALGAIMNRDAAISATTSTAELHASSVQMQSDAQRIGLFLDNNARALNNAVPGPISPSVIQSWQVSVGAARKALNASVSALASAEDARTRADAALSVANKELSFKQSPPRPEDISMAQAAITEAQSQVKIVQDKISKTVLVAPVRSRIAHVAYKTGEAYRPGAPAIVLDALAPEVQSDVSELDIVRVRSGASARITFDALPGSTFVGKVIAIDPQKIEKDGDTYYRVNFSLSGALAGIRSGMTAEVLISVSAKKNVLRIPEYATYERDGASYVRVERGDAVVEVPVTLGISDGQFREVMTGLSEGEKVVIPTD